MRWARIAVTLPAVPLITLTTDFGTGSHYVAQMKAALLRGAPEATLVDLSHDLPPQDVDGAARFLQQTVPDFPADTVHLAVIDPGVGSDRAIVAIDALGQRCVGPDNGLFGWMNDRPLAAVRLDVAKVGIDRPSNTFHGRDIMAPAAARLAEGEPLDQLGQPIEELVCLPKLPGPEVGADGVAGLVVEADQFGNLISNIAGELVESAPTDQRFRVVCGEHETFGLQCTYADQPPQTLVALIGSGGMLELAIVNGNAAQMLGAKAGDALTIDWSGNGG